MIRKVSVSDAPAICDIYNQYVANSIISFEKEEVSVGEMQSRIKNLIQNYPWLVFGDNGHVVAYAYASLWKTRSAYRNTLETTIYSQQSAPKGTGTQLYTALFEELDSTEVHSLMAVIALPNDVSVNFHEKMGYSKAGYFEEVGYKMGEWIDVGYWQKML